MNIIYLLIVLSFIGASWGLFAFLWSVATGQLDDPEGEAHRALWD